MGVRGVIKLIFWHDPHYCIYKYVSHYPDQNVANITIFVIRGPGGAIFVIRGTGWCDS